MHIIKIATVPTVTLTCLAKSVLFTGFLSLFALYIKQRVMYKVPLAKKILQALSNTFYKKIEPSGSILKNIIIVMIIKT